MRKTSIIVVPIDLAGDSRAGFEAGVRIAELLGADRVHLVHVIRDLSRWMRDLPSYSGRGVLDALALIKKSAEGRLAELSIPDADVEITREARIGAPAREIVAAAEEQAGDLIVIASKRHTPLGRLVLGSVAHTVVRASPCPVLLVDEDRPWKQPRRILAAIDLSRVSEDVLDRSMEIAQRAKADLDVISVFDLLWLSPTWQSSTTLPLDDSDRAAFAEEHRAAIDSLVERLRVPGVQVTREVTTRHPPAKVIVEHAAAIGAELIVVGASGHSAWERMVLGSTATRVLSHSNVPVLVVPTREVKASSTS